MKKMIIAILALYLPIQAFGAQVQRFLTPLRTSAQNLRGQGTQLIQRVPNTLGTGAIRGFASKPQNLGYWNAFKNRFNNLSNQFSYYMPQTMRNFFTPRPSIIKRLKEEKDNLKILAQFTATAGGLGAAARTALATTEYIKQRQLKEELDQLKEAKGSLSEIHKKTREFAGWTPIGNEENVRLKIDAIIGKVHPILKNYASDNDTDLSDLHDSINELKQNPELTYKFAYGFMTKAQAEDLEKIIKNNQQLPPSIDELLRIVVEGSVFHRELGELEDVKSNYPHLSSALNKIAAEYSK